jgi:uncharacterized glyoxalase superfamily protein PhnB
MTKRSTDAIQFPHNQRIATAKVVEGSREAGPVSDRAAARVLVEALTAGSLQSVTLKREVLLGRRNTHVADQHGFAWMIAKTERSMVYRPKIDA